MSSPANHQPESHRRHSHRKSQARLQLIGVFALLVTAFVILFMFALNPEYNRWRILIGLLFGAAVACTLLIGAVWQRQNWARYVLIVAVLGLIAIFGLTLIFLISEPVESSSQATTLVGASIGLLLCVSGWLMFSRRIRYLTTPPGSGG
jgi:Na+/proline symporter